MDGSEPKVLTPRGRLTQTGSIEARAAIAGLLWVTENKIFGGNYGFSI